MATETLKQFEQAKDADLSRAHTYLHNLTIDHDTKTRLDVLLTHLYKNLRSAVVPRKNGCQLLVDTLHKGILGSTIDLYGMLASETANQEFPFYMNLHKTLQDHGIQARPYVLVIHWPNPGTLRQLQLADTLTYPNDSPMNLHFEQEFAPIQDAWKKHDLTPEGLIGWPIEFIKPEKRTPYASGGFRNPPPEIIQASHELHKMRKNTRSPGQTFYRTHLTLSQLGDDQGDFGEVLRRATGIWIKEQSEKNQHPSLWMATERAGTLLKNYRVPKTLAGVNLKESITA